MFNLTKTEKFIILFLSASLVTALAVKFYLQSGPRAAVRIGRFNSEALQSSTNDENLLKRDKVNINIAGADEIATLKGVGKVLAGRIIEYRDLHGSFASIEDIKNVKGIGKALFEKIKDDITVE